MTITLHLTPDQERRLRERAARRGCDLDAYLQRLIDQDLRERGGEFEKVGDSIARSRPEPDPTKHETPTLDEVNAALEPFRREVRESGLTENELDDFFQDVRQKIWQEKHGHQDRTS